MVFWSSWLICSDHRLYLVYTTQTERNHRVTIPTSILTVHDKTYLVGNASDNDRDDWRGGTTAMSIWIRRSQIQSVSTEDFLTNT